LKPQTFSELKNRLEQIEQEFNSNKSSETQISLSPIEKDLSLNLNWKDHLPQKNYRDVALESNSLSSACQSLERNLKNLFGFGAFTSLYELGSASETNVIQTVVALSSSLKSFSAQYSSFESISIEEIRLKLTNENSGNLKIKLETDTKELSQFVQSCQNYFMFLQKRSKLIKFFELTSFTDNQSGFLNIQFSFNLDVLSEKSQGSATRIDA